LDSTDSIANQGNSLARPFKTLQRALIESARFSYVKGNSNDETEKTTILLMPGEHVIDNRPGYKLYADNNNNPVTEPSAGETARPYELTLDSIFDLTQKDNDLYKFNSVNGGVIVPRGTSIVGLDLRKTKLRPLYIPNPTDENISSSSIFRITGACYFWQFSIFDGDELGTVYTQSNNFNIKSTPTFSHHKLTVFEYADGVNEVDDKGLTDLQMYYAKLSRAYKAGSDRAVDDTDTFPTNSLGFNPRRPEFEIVGAFAPDPIIISSIQSGDGGTPTRQITVTTKEAHGLNVGTPIIIENVTSENAFNVSTKVTGIDNNNDKVFTYSITTDPEDINPGIFSDEGTVKIETDTVTGASPYIFNISMRSVWGMAGMHADGSKATGFRSMVVAQFTGVSLQKDDRAFVKYEPSNRAYVNTFYPSATTQQTGSELSSKSSSSSTVYHLDSESVYRKGWEQTHIKISNDAIVQIVSVFAIGYNQHFTAESGGDASVTNSNSNFGQLSLVSKGFKKEAFEKDNKAFITHIIPPRAIESSEEDIDWLTLDQDAPSNSNTKIYLFGFNNRDIKPPTLTQGYRVGAKVGDKLFLGSNSADIVMPGGSSSFEEYSFNAPSTISNIPNVFEVSNGGTHNLENREKVVIISDDGDLPENLRTNTVYYVIKINNTQIRLAASESEASNNESITVFGGTKLKILSRVSDKVAGDVGHPVQFDESSTPNQWYITVQSGAGITNQFTGTGATEPTTIKRISDNRSLDEKIYKLRVVIPSQLSNGKTPESGFVIQESSSTGFVSIADTNRTSIDSENYDWNRNPRFIKSCSESAKTVTVTTELPHDLQVGDLVTIKNVTHSDNPNGLPNKGYNGTFTVTENSTTNEGALGFKYAVETSLSGSSTNNTTTVRSTELPRFERTDCKSDMYIYRNEVISEYDSNDANGVYHLYVLNSSNNISEEFTDLNYSQNVTDLYPQLDRDNVDDSPNSAKTFALRSPIGEVQTDDLKKSITKETVDKFVKSFGIGLNVINVSSGEQPTVTFDREHGYSGIVTGSVLATNDGFTPGTYYNVKLFNEVGLSNWNGATAKVVVSSTDNRITSVEIMNGGSGYSSGNYYLDNTVIGPGNQNGVDNKFTVASTGISNAVGQVLQFTGIGTASDNYHRILAVTGKNTVQIQRKNSDSEILSGQYAFNTGNSIDFSASGDTITATGHGLIVGNKFRVINSSNENVGDYIVEAPLTVNTFTVTGGIGAASGIIMKHGLSSNEGISDKTDENLQSRGVTIFDGEVLTISESGGINDSITAFSVSGEQGGIIERFPLGTYIQVDKEIMRIASNSLSGSSADKITVIRGALATRPESHVQNSVVKKIKVPAIEFHRPSIIRASGHTFEYLGYGPGNYSTALPQVQDRSLTEREEFLSQSQERSGGLVVYTGMNNKGDFFIGNQKKSSATGEETNFDIPVPTITGEDPSRLSAVFDEVTIKERLVVEGGDSKQVLSQFDGPVTFNQKVKITATNSVTPNPTALKVSTPTESNGKTSGALVVTGGVGIGKKLNVGGESTFTGNINANGNIVGDTATNISDINQVTASTFVGNLTGDVTGNVTGDVTGNVTGDVTGNVTGDVTGDILSPNGTTVLNNGTGDGTNSTFSGNAATSTKLATARTIGGVSFDGTANIDLPGVNGEGSQNTSGNAASATQVKTTSSATDSNFRVAFYDVETATTGNVDLLNDGGCKYNPSTNKLTISGEGRFDTVVSNNDITAFASDDRLKTNVSPITDALFKVNSLDGFTYNFNDIAGQLGFDTKIDYAGVSAQQVQKVLPEVVKPAPRDNNYITVQYEKLVPLLIEAIKELSDKVDELEQKLSDK
jgi:hypothetical protein